MPTWWLGRAAARRRAPGGRRRRTPRPGGRRCTAHDAAGRLNRSGNASRSRLGTPIIGTRSAWAIALAVATPTRRPVNRPGPEVDGDARRSPPARRRAWRQMNSIAGASDSAWRLPRAECDDASTPSCPPMAQPTCAVAVSMPRISTVRPTAAASARPAPRSPGRPARGRRRRSSERAVVVAVAEARAAPRGSRRAATGTIASPHSMTRHARRRRASRRRPRSSDLLQVLEAVHVEVVQRAAGPSYSRTMVNVGLVTGSVTPRPRPEALGERGLARAEVAGRAARGRPVGPGRPARRPAPGWPRAGRSGRPARS